MPARRNRRRHGCSTSWYGKVSYGKAAGAAATRGRQWRRHNSASRLNGATYNCRFWHTSALSPLPAAVTSPGFEASQIITCGVLIAGCSRSPQACTYLTHRKLVGACDHNVLTTTITPPVQLTDELLAPCMWRHGCTGTCCSSSKKGLNPNASRRTCELLQYSSATEKGAVWRLATAVFCLLLAPSMYY